jgi:hypothetical protein
MCTWIADPKSLLPSGLAIKPGPLSHARAEQHMFTIGLQW